MCGRLALTSTDQLVDEFGPIEVPITWRPRYNLAPTEDIPIIRARAGASDPTSNTARRELSLARWGLVPSWAKDPAIGNRMINARGESVADKPAFRDALRKQRCIVPADGFYEWKREGRARTPFFVRYPDGRPLALAGLWSRWRAPDGDWLESFTVITAPANALIRPIHDRMPVLVDREDYARWLHPGPLPPEALADILVSPPDDALERYEVSPRVNSVKNDDPACIEPTGPPPGQISLF